MTAEVSVYKTANIALPYRIHITGATAEKLLFVKECDFIPDYTDTIVATNLIKLVHKGAEHIIDQYPPDLLVETGLICKMYLGVTQLPYTIVKNGETRSYLDGKLHSVNDEPALIDAYGDKHWCKHGDFHREGDKPAIVETDGSVEYYINNKQHRDGDMPAYICADGQVTYYKNGNIHRDGDLPADIRANGDKYYHKNGKLHRDGPFPAVIKANKEEYWQNGERVFGKALAELLAPLVVKVHTITFELPAGGNVTDTRVEGNKLIVNYTI